MAAPFYVARAARQAACSAVRRPQVFCPTSRIPAQARLFSARSAFQAKKYTEDHEWIDLSDDGKTATLGITSFAAKQLGDVVYIELPEEGLEAGAGEAIGAVESVKSASDILTPVAGKVSAVNATLGEKPGNINKDPEGEGWIAKIEVEGEPEGTMMSEAEYKEFIADA